MAKTIEELGDYVEGKRLQLIAFKEVLQKRDEIFNRVANAFTIDPTLSLPLTAEQIDFLARESEKLLIENDAEIDRIRNGTWTSDGISNDPETPKNIK